MIKRVLFWLGNSRPFSIPMTVMSWLIVFIYSLKQGGDIINGTLALIGILFAHLATNLFDDYVDYRRLSKNDAFMNNISKSKCRYLQTGEADLAELLKVVIIYCAIAFIIGVILTFKCGYWVILLAVIGGLITLTYACLSSNGLSELAVGTAFGPLLFEGVHYVMCSKFSIGIFIISLAVVAFTVGLVYANNLLDLETDLKSGKKSLCCRLGNKSAATKGLLMIHFIGYLLFIVLAVLKREVLYALPLVTCPLAIEAYNILKDYPHKELPKIKFWYKPLDNWEKIKTTPTADFYLGLLIVRNTMMWVSLIFCLVLLIVK